MQVCIFEEVVGIKLYSLVKVSEKIDPESVLFVQLVTICVFDSIQSMSGRHIFQEDIPAAKQNQFIYIPTFTQKCDAAYKLSYFSLHSYLSHYLNFSRDHVHCGRSSPEHSK